MSYEERIKPYLDGVKNQLLQEENRREFNNKKYFFECEALENTLQRLGVIEVLTDIKDGLWKSGTISIKKESEIYDFNKKNDFPFNLTGETYLMATLSNENSSTGSISINFLISTFRLFSLDDIDKKYTYTIYGLNNKRNHTDYQRHNINANDPISSEIIEKVSLDIIKVSEQLREHIQFPLDNPQK